MRDTINIIGVRTHNLKNIDIKIPRDKLVIITGISGSGKSSLAFDTLYAEGQRRYTESLSSYARQFLSMMDKPDIDYIDGLSPAIAIQQKNVSHNPRSTVGTVTEIHDYLRLLYARAGTAYCPEHNKPLHAQVVSDMTDSLLKNFKDQRIAILAPVIRGRKGEYSGLLQNLQRQGFIRARIDDIDYELDSPPKLDKNLKHNIDAIVDRLKVTPENIQRIAESLENALKLSDGLAKASLYDDPKAKPMLFSSKFSCPECDYSIPELEPRIFSFNSPHGACQECQGLGNKRFFDPKRIVHEQLSINEGAIRGWNISSPYYFGMLKDVCDHYEISMDKSFSKLKENEQKILLYGSGKEKIAFSTFKYSKHHTYEGVIPSFDRRYRDTDSSYIQDELLKFMSIAKCTECDGARICKEALHVRIANKNLAWVNQLAIEDSLKFAKEVKITGKQGIVSEKILREVVARLEFLNDVGLGYLSLNRSADTLSGGETQRIRLASQIGSGLVGVLYVLDEPSIGLHQRDNRRLLDTLHKLRDLGNSLIVVEHDQETISDADHIIDIGPGAGIHGGELVAQGSIQDIMAAKDSLTGDYLAGRKEITVPKTRRAYDKSKSLNIQGANGNNLQDVDVSIPLGLFTCVTGVSGSGKSTLINQTLYPLAAQKLNRATLVEPKEFREIEGLDMLDKVINIDQSPIGRTPRSNPATYIGMFTYIRELFSSTNEARTRGYGPGRFSFNVRGGRCESCKGDGVTKVEMHFLSDIYVPCDTCNGKRYGRETLEIQYRGKNIYDVLEMTIEDASEFFANLAPLKQKLDVLMEVGLSYIKMGHSATLLSGGEAQRIKLSKELSRRNTGQTLYVLDEPTTGLHFHDIKQLMAVLHKLRDLGNTVIVIEHNLDVIKTADWVIDMGPDGGNRGGHVIGFGTPEQLSKQSASITGKYLKEVLDKSKGAGGKGVSAKKSSAKKSKDTGESKGSIWAATADKPEVKIKEDSKEDSKGDAKTKANAKKSS